MTFSEFAKALFSILAEGRKVEEFTHDLFINIVDYDDSEDNPVEDTELGTFRAYYNGRNGISKLAKAISSHLDQQKFEMYLERFPSGTTLLLRDALLPFNSKVNEFNCYEKCAEMLKEIILESTTRKRRTKTKVTVQSKDNSVNNVNSDFTTRLLLEASGICANDNCNKPLYINKEQDSRIYFDCVIIDDSQPPDSFENNIAFCHECAAKYRLNTSAEEIERVKHIKSRLIKNASDRELLSESQVTEGVKRVIQKISESISEEPEAQLSYDPMTVDQKLLPVSKPLYLKVKSFVTEYYTIVFNAFTQLDKAKVIRFHPFSLQMKMNYIQLIEGGTEPNRVFDKLVDWIAEITNEDRMWCEIVVSYFIQKCEVYGAITE